MTCGKSCSWYQSFVGHNKSNQSGGFQMHRAEKEIPIQASFHSCCSAQDREGFSLEEGRYFPVWLTDHLIKPKDYSWYSKYCPLFLYICGSARIGGKRKIVAIGKSETGYIYPIIQCRESQTSFNQAILHIRSRPEDSSTWNNLFGHETEYIHLWLSFRTHVTAQMWPS